MDFSTKLNGFFFIRTKIMDFSRNYHASHEIISFVVISMDFFSFVRKLWITGRNNSNRLSIGYQSGINRAPIGYPIDNLLITIDNAAKYRTNQAAQLVPG